MKHDVFPHTLLAPKQRREEEKRAARRKAVRTSFEERRNALEQVKAWQGPRKFEEWLLHLAEEVLQRGDKAAAPKPPEVCACCVTFIDIVVCRRGECTRI